MKIKRIKARIKPKVCECYHEKKSVGYLTHPWPGCPQQITITVGECWGTRERDMCSCKGNTSKCDFYPEKRNK